MKSFERCKRILKFQAHRVKVYEDILKKPDGEIVRYDYVENRNGAGILLIDSDGKLIFVKQYRNTLDDYDIEIPAGCMEETDIKSVDDFNPCIIYANGKKLESTNKKDVNSFARCAVRESIEETGLQPGKLIYINYMIAAVGLFSERTAIFIGEDIEIKKRNPDPDEYIDLVFLTLKDAVDKVYAGEICDSKTIIAILAYNDLKKKSEY